ncbi:hypothetical protein [Mesorhizobium amorphae]|uniref:hypothetical protein n=1 Tax=Mesorhizobium amorphae TaxID=71433 RepID=UPI0017875A89|nr:hypothetical protein [Mesorhizobium amorphae]
MLEVKAKPFVHAISQLASMSTLIRTLNEHKPEMPTVKIDKRGAKQFDAFLKPFIESCGPMGAKISSKAAERIVQMLKDKSLNYVELGMKFETLAQTFRDELESSRLFALNVRTADYFALATETFGADVIANFPDTEYDLEEAGKCLATARNTATVFHLMRALEVTLQFLCKKLNIPNTQRVWGFLLSDLNQKIEAMPKGEEKSRWAAASSYLWQIKEVWRNETMHPKQTYTDEEARDVFEASRVFIRHAAKLV